MKIIGLMLCRNSDWILGLSARAALMWCDALVIAHHSSTDGTADIVHSLLVESAPKIYAWSFWNPDFIEMGFRNEMLKLAREIDATHIALIDDDEVLSGNLLSRIRDIVESTPKGSVLMLPWLQMENLEGDLGWMVMTSGHWGRSPVSVAFPDSSAYHWKSQEGGYDHHHRHPMGKPFHPHSPIDDRASGLMHFQFASRRRLLAKQFWYQLQERLRWPSRPVQQVAKMYSFTVEESAAAQVEAAPVEWFEPYAHLMQHLHLDREPWQAAECKRILTEHPGIASGLNDFGLIKEWGIK